MDSSKIQNITKVGFLGPSSAGKTYFLYRYANHADKHISPLSTLGVDFFIASIKHHNGKMAFQLWDSPGANRFHTCLQFVMCSTNLYVLFYDVQCKDDL
jgi:Ras-related protein Rab-1A